MAAISLDSKTRRARKRSDAQVERWYTLMPDDLVEELRGHGVRDPRIYVCDCGGSRCKFAVSYGYHQARDIFMFVPALVPASSYDPGEIAIFESKTDSDTINAFAEMLDGRRININHFVNLLPLARDLVASVRGNSV